MIENYLNLPANIYCSMFQQPTIQILSTKNLVGHSLPMSLKQNRTMELWKGFMPLRKAILNTLSTDLISMRVYEAGYDFNAFDPSATFKKWAAMEVANFKAIPSGMDTFVLKGGLYAVFAYRGLNTDMRIFEYIFHTWLPSSGFALDNRPHFEVLGEKYKNNDPASEEEIWVPVKERL